MSELSPRLALPFLAPAQAQKHVTHNEALILLDTLVQLTVEGFDATTPPVAPAEGETWATGPAPGGDWAGQGGMIASFRDGGWIFLAPADGWCAYGRTEAEIRLWQSGNWGPLPAPAVQQNLDLLGIGTTADATNRLAVASPATLLTHQGAGHQIKVNKAAPGDTASLMFQTGFSGRAEMGTPGSDDFALKVSADGTTWTTALVAQAAGGAVSLPGGVLTSGFALRDGADPSKQAAFALGGLTPGAAHSYALPDYGGTFALLGGAQTYAGSKTFAGPVTITSPTASLGTATASASYGLGTGATLTGNAKSVDIGTGGAAGSATTITLGSASAGALGETVVNTPTVSFAAAVTAISAPQAALSVRTLGLGPLATDPVAPTDGTLWLNSSTGTLRSRTGGATRNVSGLEIPFLVPAAGDHVMTTCGTGAITSQVAGAAGRMEIFPFAPRADLSIDQMKVNVTVGVASAQVRIVVYSADAQGRPDTLLFESADVDCGSGGMKSAVWTSGLWQGVTYWFGLRHSANATLSNWQPHTTPDINGGAPFTTVRKTLRRTLAYATPAPTTWGFTSAEINAAFAPAIWLRVA